MLFGTDALGRAKLALLAMQRHSWEQGAAMQAFLEAGEEEVVVALAKEAAYRAMPDGRCATIGVTDAVTDPCSVGEALKFAADKTGDSDLLTAYGRLLNWALYLAPRNDDGILYHLMDRKQFWVDSMYMLPPFLAAADHIDEAMRQWNGYFDALYDPDCQLMCHMWDDEKQVYARKAHWGVGNGWALASIPRMVALAPAFSEALIGRAGLLVEGLVRHLREDGLFHDVVDDPSSFVETNLSQMLSYMLFRGYAQGWVSKDMLELAERLYQAALSKQDRFGLVRDVCGAPTFDKPGIAPEGQAFFILMSTARAAIG